MTDSTHQGILQIGARSGTMHFDLADLRAVEHMITMRLSGTAESARTVRMRHLVRVTSVLTRTLSTYSQHALVHCQGTAGASDLSSDTEKLGAALEAFCREIGDVAAEYTGRVTGTDPEWREPLPFRATTAAAPRQVNAGDTR